MSKLQVLTELVVETHTFQMKRGESSFRNRLDGFKKIDGYGEALISSRMKTLFRDLSDIFYDEFRYLSRSWSRADWSQLVSRIFMDEYFTKFLDISPEYAAPGLLTELENQLGSHSLDRDVKFTFGCEIFSNSPDEIVNFGKVKFFGRSVWLDEQINRGKISNPLYNVLRFKWGMITGPILPLLDENENYIEQGISDFLGKSHYICEVNVSNLAGDAAEAKALMAMNFAKTAIALIWSRPSKALRAMPSMASGYPRIVYRGLFVDGDYKGNSAWSTRGFGQPLIGTNWNNLEKDYHLLFSIVSDVIDYCLSPTGDVLRPKIMDTFAHALLWFHEACTEDLPMVAITKFVASLDALASGSGGASGIVEVVTSQLGVEKGDPIRDGGPSFEQAIKDIYGSGRSRLLHGNSDRLMEDWQVMRDLTEELSRITLVLCLNWAGKNTLIDDPKKMKNKM